MQRALGPYTHSLLRPGRQGQTLCHGGLSRRPGRPACQAASTLSNGESGATAGVQVSSSKAASTSGSGVSTTGSPSQKAPAAAAPKVAAAAAPPPASASAGPKPSTAGAAAAAAGSSGTAHAPQPGPAGASAGSPSSSSPTKPVVPPAVAAAAATGATTEAVSSAATTTTASSSSSSSGSQASSPSSADGAAAGVAARVSGPSASTRDKGSGSEPRPQEQQQQQKQQEQEESPSAPPPPAFSQAFLRRLAASTSAMDVSEALAEEFPAGAREDEARAVIGFVLQRGRVKLALALYREMCQARRGGSGMGGSGGGGGSVATRSLDGPFAWPPATLATTRELVLGLCQQLCTVEALQVLADMKVQGLPRGSEEVGFGKVITSPLAPSRPLTVVQPQEGAKTVADGYSRYEYDVFSGTTVSCSSKALVPSGNLLLGLARAVGLIKKAPVAAVHEFVLQAPDSSSRTFRVGTESAAVPAQVGERVTVVSAPARNVRQGGLFNASPPGTRPGEALTATNHKTGTVLSLLRPPASAEQAAGSGIPSWVLPVAVVLAGGDAASALLDPALPVLLAAGAASLAGSAALGNSVLLPRLKQLPETKLRAEQVRQGLLSEYNGLATKAAQALTECGEDVRVLARLWQLQNKMEAVAGTTAAAAAAASASSSAGGYEARIGRVARARANIEERLSRRVELLEGYSRVMNMIEIEVEMDLEVPAAELAGIQEQVAKLVELEALQEDWRTQAEARDEVERLLRAA